MTKLNWGMIGGGEGSQIGPAHRLGSGLDGEFNFVAGALDHSPDAGRDYAERLGIAGDRSYGDWREMLAGESAREDRVDGDRAAAESACAGAIEHERIDAFDQTMSRYEIALGLASAGLHEQAIDQIEFLLAGPVGKSFSRYEIEPAFRPLHQNPRWQALKTKYGVGE